MLTNTELRVVFPRWPSIGFKISSSQTTSCSTSPIFQISVDHPARSRNLRTYFFGIFREVLQSREAIDADVIYFVLGRVHLGDNKALVVLVFLG